MHGSFLYSRVLRFLRYVYLAAAIGGRNSRGSAFMDFTSNNLTGS